MGPKEEVLVHLSALGSELAFTEAPSLYLLFTVVTLKWSFKPLKIIVSQVVVSSQNEAKV